MTKLWTKNPANEHGVEESNKTVEAFETRDDLAMDQKLVKYDIEGTIAHAAGLYKIGILNKKELEAVKKGLNEILKLISMGKFKLELGDEDMHTKIENYLTENYGETGKKIHTGRSRNDQVLTALRLYGKTQLGNVKREIREFMKILEGFENKYGIYPMPGYTHMQKAMPSTVGLWAGSFIAALKDDLKMIKAVYDLTDQSPLGSAAGYGVPIKLEKAYTAKIMGFQKVQENPMYCQLSRGKFEAFVLASLAGVLLTINKFASDIMLFTTSEFGFFEVAEKLTTGSSIMPQKKNLDLAELLRSKVHLVLGQYVSTVSLSSNLPSGYNRDLQDGKKPLIESLEMTIESLTAVKVLIENIKPNKAKLMKAMTEELFATERALKLVLKGESFRDAYKNVGENYLKGGEIHEK